MIAGSILYLLMPGQDMGTAAEQLLNGMYTSYVILAVPLFILAAEFMNTGTMTERLLRFCDALVGRFRGGLAQVNVVQSIIFAGMSGSAIADAAGTGKMMQYMMTKDGKYTAELRGGADRGHRGDRADHSAVDPDGALRARLRCLDRLPVPRRRHSRACSWRCADGAWSPSRRGATIFRSSRRCRCASSRASPGSFPALLMPVVLLGGIYRRRDDADRGRRGRRRLCAVVSVLSLPQHDSAALRLAPDQRAHDQLSIGMLIAGALVFNYVITIENIPKSSQHLLKALGLTPVAFLLLVNVLLLLLGCVLEGTTILLVFVPVLLPTAHALGIDLVHFGVMVVVNIMIGLFRRPMDCCSS